MEELKPCQVKGCGKKRKPGKYYRYCSMHIWRLYNKGSLSWAPLPQFKRILARIKKTAQGCWEYQGKKSNGYGEVIVKNKRLRAHRYIYELVFGKLQKKILACHRCDNPPCINPSHLFSGTHKDNFEDAKMKGRISPLYDRTKR